MKATGKNAELKTALLSLEREENDDEQVIVKVAARNAGKTPKRKQTFPPVWPRMHTDPKGLKMLLQEVCPRIPSDLMSTSIASAL